jgi:alpha,alpha-trehalase
MRSDKLFTTSTGEIIPVDLNCLVAHLQTSVVGAQMLNKLGFVDSNSINDFKLLMKQAYRDIFFNEELGWYCDYDTVTKRTMNNPTLAGMFPLFFKLADEKDVPRIVDFLKKNFLKPGGVVTSLNTTGQQWDAPNGWAPLQWITIIGLDNYGYHHLAKDIAKRWVSLNKKVFRSTGKLMEKYDVINLKKPAGGGEYPSQDGFGWTNGVLLALINKYKL